MNEISDFIFDEKKILSAFIYSQHIKFSVFNQGTSLICIHKVIFHFC